VDLQKAVQLAKRENERSSSLASTASLDAPVSLPDQGIGLVCAVVPNEMAFQLHVFAALAQEERRLISERTKTALAEAKRRGKILVQIDGIRPPRIARRLTDLHLSSGRNWMRI
jgi:hypothetical protein